MEKIKEYHVACCGLGVNSIAYILECTERGIIFDLILFGNTGIGKKDGEKKATYAYVKLFNEWLIAHGQPKLTIVHSRNAEGKLISLHDEMFKLKTLPAIVFGWKTCSQRFKIQPQDKYLKKWILKNHKILCEFGGKIWNVSLEDYLKDNPKDKSVHDTYRVKKYIGYDADESHRVTSYTDKNYDVYFPLIDFDWGRFECIERIIRSGLAVPPKSACKWCPSTKPWQIIELYEESTEEFYECIRFEDNAIGGGRMTEVKGLGRDYSWKELIAAYRYLNLLKKHGVYNYIHPRMRSMLKKINRSRPVILKPRQKEDSVRNYICDLFTVKNEVPCGCYDGE